MTSKKRNKAVVPDWRGLLLWHSASEKLCFLSLDYQQHCFTTGCVFTILPFLQISLTSSLYPLLDFPHYILKKKILIQSSLKKICHLFLKALIKSLTYLLRKLQYTNMFSRYFHRLTFLHYVWLWVSFSYSHFHCWVIQTDYSLETHGWLSKHESHAT